MVKQDIETEKCPFDIHVIKHKSIFAVKALLTTSITLRRVFICLSICSLHGHRQRGVVSLQTAGWTAPVMDADQGPGTSLRAGNELTFLCVCAFMSSIKGSHAPVTVPLSEIHFHWHEVIWASGVGGGGGGGGRRLVPMEKESNILSLFKPPSFHNSTQSFSSDVWFCLSFLWIHSNLIAPEIVFTHLNTVITTGTFHTHMWKLTHIRCTRTKTNRLARGGNMDCKCNHTAWLQTFSPFLCHSHSHWKQFIYQFFNIVVSCEVKSFKSILQYGLEPLD